MYGVAFTIISITVLALIPISAYCTHVTPDVSDPQPIPIPQPGPEPKPIPRPVPEPITNPFPEESDAEKIQRLTQENKALRNEIHHLLLEKNSLEQYIAELEEKIDNLYLIITEQIEVIIELLNGVSQTFLSSGRVSLS